MEIKYVNKREDYIKGYEKGRRLALKFEIFKLTLIMLVVTGIFFYFINELSDFYNVKNSTYLNLILISATTVIITSILINIISKRNITTYKFLSK